MTFDEALKFVKDTKPNILYIGGKTSTGKTTFASQLQRSIEYHVVELDKVVHESVVQPFQISDEGKAFNEVYKRRDKPEWINAFIKAADNQVGGLIEAGHKVIIDGAIANPETLRELLASLTDVVTLYFHPTNLDVYERNLTNRFMLATPNHSAGLPTQFWKLVDKVEFKRFCETGEVSASLRDSISKYAKESKQSSEDRIQQQAAVIPEMKIVNI